MAKKLSLNIIRYIIGYYNIDPIKVEADFHPPVYYSKAKSTILGIVIIFIAICLKNWLVGVVGYLIIMRVWIITSNPINKNALQKAKKLKNIILCQGLYIGVKDDNGHEHIIKSIVMSYNDGDLYDEIRVSRQADKWLDSEKAKRLAHVLNSEFSNGRNKSNEFKFNENEEKLNYYSYRAKNRELKKINFTDLDFYCQKGLFVFGMTEEEQVLTVRNPKNILVTGSSRSGKTDYTKMMLFQYWAMGYDIYLSDIKRTDLAEFANMLNRMGLNQIEISETIPQTLRMIRKYAEKVDFRYKIMGQNKAFFNGVTWSGAGVNEEYLADGKNCVLICDEYLSLVAQIEDKKDLKSLEKNMTTIVQMGLQASQSVMVILQRPDSSYLSGDLKLSFANKFLIGSSVNNSINRNMMFSNTNKEIFEECKAGQGYLLSEDYSSNIPIYVESVYRNLGARNDTPEDEKALLNAQMEKWLIDNLHNFPNYTAYSVPSIKLPFEEEAEWNDFNDGAE